MHAPDNCDVCTSYLRTLFYDAATHSGQWAYMCEGCWRENTRQRLGIGLGQKYEVYRDASQRGNPRLARKIAG